MNKNELLPAISSVRRSIPILSIDAFIHSCLSFIPSHIITIQRLQNSYLYVPVGTVPAGRAVQYKYIKRHRELITHTNNSWKMPKMPTPLRKFCILVFFKQLIIFCHGAAIPSLAKRRQTCQTSAPSKLPLGFTVSRLEKEERERGAGIWVADTDFQLEDAVDDCDYEFDEIEDDEDFEITEEKTKPRQKSFSTEVESEKGPKENEDDEHPMRTDEWLVNVNLSPILLPGNSESDLFPDSRVDGDISSSQLRKKSKRRKHQIIKFAKNGYVVLMEDTSSDIPSVNNDQCHGKNSKQGENDANNSDDQNQNRNRVTKIGKWKIDTSGISWSIPVHVKSSDSVSKRTTLHYHADIHLSKFQEQPRMFRGVITRDRFHDWALQIPLMPKFEKNFFRPVIATFTAQGIGRDTVDVSYKNRGFGLNNGAPNSEKVENAKGG